jgi:hypothetical protein
MNVYKETNRESNNNNNNNNNNNRVNRSVVKETRTKKEEYIYRRGTTALGRNAYCCYSVKKDTASSKTMYSAK